MGIRNINKWLKSRYRKWSHFQNEWNVNIAKDAINTTLNKTIDDIQVLNQWKVLWYQYHCNLLKYFKKNNLMDKLIIFDVENDSPDKLVNFFANFNFTLDPSLYPHSNIADNITGKKYTERLEKWENIEKSHPYFATDHDDEY